MINKMELPGAFVEATTEMLGSGEAGRLFDALDTPVPVSVRFNPYKLSEQPEGRRVPWSRYGYYLDQRPQFTLDPLFHAGAYYVQEASSMFVEHVYREAVGGDLKKMSERFGLEYLSIFSYPRTISS